MALSARTAMPNRIEAAGLSLLHWPGEDSRVPLVLLHGIGSHAESWQPLVAALESAAAVVAWDAPGYGASRPLAAARPRPDDYADDLDAMLQVLGYDRVVLVGHSLGALFAARFAATRPRKVAALGLLSPALGYAVAPGVALPSRVQARIDDLDRLGPVAFAAARASRLVHDAASRPGLVARVRQGMEAVRQPGYGQAAWALGAGTLAADAAVIPAPALVAVGLEDAVTPPVGARAINALLDRSLGLFEIANTGHALPQEAPGEGARLVGHLLQEAERGR